jgi:hypothetical protein
MKIKIFANMILSRLKVKYMKYNAPGNKKYAIARKPSGLIIKLLNNNNNGITI